MENIETLLAAVAQTQGFDDDEPPSVVVRGDTGDRKLIDEVSGDVRSSAVVDKLLPAPETVVPARGRVIGEGEKRKRGRPPRGQLAAKPLSPKRKKIEDEDEDVCFICFDGGSLVLCDRKGCPKAYHPACIKRDEAFFQSKAKWNCGWHICSVCLKTSHYMCYTCTYSLCKGCTKDKDYVCVRGNKGFCSTCMKTIMLIENKDQATNEVQVDFDDKTSWEYLFKVYWVLLKEKLSLTLIELLHAKNPWKGVTGVDCKPRFSNVPRTAGGGEVSVSCRSTEHLELNKPHVEMIQNDGFRTTLSSNSNHVEKLNSDKGENGPSCNKDTVKSNTHKVPDETSIGKATDMPCLKDSTKEPCIKKNQDGTVKDTNNPCICKNTTDRESDKPGTGSNQWASKDLLELVAYVKNGDTSPISQFDVQTLLLDYIKRNNLRDPRRKSEIVCDLRLRNLFGKPRVGHIEMLKLLEYHFLIKEDFQKNSSIPAGFVSSVASDAEVDGNIYGLPTPTNNRKRKSRKKGEDIAPQHDANEYAAIDVHNINLIYLRRNLMENLISDLENFNTKVIGSIVRIRISANDQKPEVFRLVQVVGTSKVAEPYKVGDRISCFMLEILNLDKKEVVSIDAISNLEFTEDECRRLRQSIRCGLMKQLTIVQNKALTLQSVRVNDWLEAEVMRLNHLRDRASEKGHKKELREYVDRLELLKSPEERQRRIYEVPEIHSDPKMNQNYESEEETKTGGSCKTDEYARASCSSYPRNRRKSSSPNKRGKDEQRTEAGNRKMEKTDATGSNGMDKHMNQINIDSSATAGRNDVTLQRSGLETSTAAASTGTSPSADDIETEKLWHYRDPNGKIQGPFSMMQLRKWSTTGLFPPDMRIWTNHEQYDSLLLTDALNGKLHGTSDFSYKPSSGSQENRATREISASEGTNGTTRDNKHTEVSICNSVSVSSDNNAGFVRADEPGSSSWPQCWDLLKDGNSSANDVQEQNLLSSSSSGERNVNLNAQGHESSEHRLQYQSNNEDRAGQPSEENFRSSEIDLSSKDMESVSVFHPLSKPPDSSKQAENIELFDFPSPTPKSENQQPVSADLQMQDSDILELLDPRSDNEYQEGQATETKQSDFPVFPNSGPVWGGSSSIGPGSVPAVQLQEVAEEWCGYSPTPAKPTTMEWGSDLVSCPSSKPPKVMSENLNVLVSDSLQLSHASTPQPASNMPNWLTIMNEPIEFDAFGEEAVSDLLAEVETMESQRALPSPTSAMKFARELMEDCKDDCFSSIEDFSPAPEPRKSDALSSTSDVQLTSQSSTQCKPIESSPVDAFDFFKRSSVHSSASSEGETSAPVQSGDAGSEFHPPTPTQDMVGATTAPGPGSDTTDPGWCPMQGNINLVTVQGNVNLVLGGPVQGMANIGWGTNSDAGWASPNISQSPRNGSSQLPWDSQRKYGGERYTSPRERGYQGNDTGFGRGGPHGVGNNTAVEVIQGLFQKGREYVNSMKVDTAKRDLSVITCIHDC